MRTKGAWLIIFFTFITQSIFKAPSSDGAFLVAFFDALSIVVIYVIMNLVLSNAKKINKDFIADKLNLIFSRHGVKRATLFGSVAKNAHDEYSDIDIMVESNLKGIKFFGLLEDIVNTLESDVDLIDKSQIIYGSKVDNEIKNTGVLIYG